jgi:hypothetical protein
MFSTSGRSKKTFWIHALIIVALTLPLEMYLNWWCIVPMGLIYGFVFTKNLSAPFLLGFISIFVQWATYAAFLDYRNAGILSQRIIKLFPLPQYSIVLILVTGVIGGLIMGFTVLSGNRIRAISGLK